MGLTIHYSLHTDLTEVGEVRTLLESIRQVARDLPFKEVGEVVEFQGEDADYERTERGDPNRWLKIQAGAYFQDGDDHWPAKPTHIIALHTWPGEGCEPANFGFCKYPAMVELPIPASSRKRKLRTKLVGWRWSSFCKTQYASSQDCGGIENFLRCHLCVVKLLGFIQHTGMAFVDVRDEGEYWDHRDLAKLAREVGEWNEFIAAFAGQLKDQAKAAGVVVESAISGFGNFEHLEAKGLARLHELFYQKPKKPE